jgi:hypothetical protein
MSATKSKTPQRTEYERMMASLLRVSSDDQAEVHEVTRIIAGVVESHGIFGRMALTLAFAKLAAIESEHG